MTQVKDFNQLIAPDQDKVEGTVSDLEASQVKDKLAKHDEVIAKIEFGQQSLSDKLDVLLTFIDNYA